MVAQTDKGQVTSTRRFIVLMSLSDSESLVNNKERQQGKVKFPCCRFSVSPSGYLRLFCSRTYFVDRDRCMSRFYIITDQADCCIATMPHPLTHFNDLEQAISYYRSEGIDILLSLLTSPESKQIGLEQMSDLCESHDIKFINHPIADYSVPDDVADFKILLQGLNAALRQGKKLLIHCWGGIGRSSLTAACLLACYGMRTKDAFDLIAEKRGCPVPDKIEQRSWVQVLEQDLIEMR